MCAELMSSGDVPMFNFVGSTDQRLRNDRCSYALQVNGRTSFNNRLLQGTFMHTIYYWLFQE